MMTPETIEYHQNELAKELAIMRHTIARKADEEVCWQRYNELLRTARRSRFLAYGVIVAVITGAAGVSSELGQMILHRVSEWLQSY